MTEEVGEGAGQYRKVEVTHLALTGVGAITTGRVFFPSLSYCVTTEELAHATRQTKKRIRLDHLRQTLEQ